MVNPLFKAEVVELLGMPLDRETDFSGEHRVIARESPAVYEIVRWLNSLRQKMLNDHGYGFITFNPGPENVDGIVEGLNQERENLRALETPDDEERAYVLEKAVDYLSCQIDQFESMQR